MDNDYSSFRSHYQDLADYFSPRRLRFETSENNKGDKKNNRIIDSTGVFALRTLASGMMSGITSPARPWFKLTTPDPELAEFAEVKRWLHFVQQRMQTVITRSNVYNVLPTCYGDIGLFGTGTIMMEEDFERVVRSFSFVTGSYRLMSNDKNQVDTFAREIELTVKQCVEKFGQYDDRTGKPNWDVFSYRVKDDFNKGNYASKVKVRHFILPNQEFKPGNPFAKYKRFASCYYEAGEASRNDKHKFLRQSGYDLFPVLAPRWQVSGEDVYGTNSPGMIALGDNKSLQLMHKRKAQAIEYQVRPAWVAPTSMKGTNPKTLPGGVTYGDSREGEAGLRPAFQNNTNLSYLIEDIREHQKRINSSFYADLFLMMAQSDRRQITATEIDERREEKLLALGPVLEQLNQDLLDPMIDLIFQYMDKQGMIPEPPEELQGIPLKVEYISIMAQAQKLVGISSVERFTSYVGQVASVDPNVLKKVKSTQLVDEYGELVSISPNIIRTDDEVAELEAEEARAQQAQAQAEMLRQGAGVAKDLSQSKIEDDNALGAILNQAQAGQIVEGV
jgi:hypothetical protein